MVCENAGPVLVDFSLHSDDRKNKRFFEEKIFNRVELVKLKLKALLDAGTENSVATINVFKLAKGKDVDTNKLRGGLPV